MVAEGLFVFGCSLAAWIRRRRLSEEERFVLEARFDLPGNWNTRNRTMRILYRVFAGAAVVALVSAIIVVVLPKSGDQFTEFYILGPEGLAEDYPREVRVGQPVRITTGIANQEGVAAGYHVKVVSSGRLVGQADTVRLFPGQVDERMVTFAPSEAGKDIPIEFLLYRDDGAEPYRSLRLWLEVHE
jgi:uncharacterized membrane protein